MIAGRSAEEEAKKKLKGHTTGALDKVCGLWTPQESAGLPSRGEAISQSIDELRLTLVVGDIISTSEGPPRGVIGMTEKFSERSGAVPSFI